MGRDYSPREAALRGKARRAHALERNELRGPSEPRQAPVGATSFPVKVTDPATAELIAAALAKRKVKS